MKQTRCAVYDVILGGEIVYVGSAPDPADRMSCHRGGWGFMREAHVVVCQWHETRPAARTAEAERIRTLAPPFNIIFHPDYKKDKAAHVAVVKSKKMALEEAFWDRERASWGVAVADVEQHLKSEIQSMSDGGASMADILTKHPYLDEAHVRGYLKATR
jgi:hypothetical protein